MVKPPPEAAAGLPRVIVPLSVAERFTREIQANPQVEVGGKYVGFLRGVARCRTLEERRLALRELTFEVTDYLDDGPEAHRTPSFHRGDARWQTAQFRKLEARQPEIEQLGSWHSHHPNGFPALSTGDIVGYQETVDHPGHNHDFFLVSLGIDLNGFSTAQHYLFVRGSKHYYELPQVAIQVVEQSPHPPVGEAGTTDRPGTPEPDPAANSKQTGGGHQSAAAVGAEPVFVHAVSSSGPARPAGPAREDDQSSSAAWRDSDGESRWVPGWSESPAGRDALLAEYRLLRQPEFVHLRLSIGQGRLLARGWVETSIGRISVSLLYPTVVGRQDGLLKLATLDEPLIDTTVSGALASGLDGASTSLKHFVDYVARYRPRAQEKQGRGTWIRNITRWD